MDPSGQRPDVSAAPSVRRRSWARVAIAAGILAWAGGVAWGLQKIESYSSTPGMAAEAPAKWPGSALVTPQAGRSTLVMFIHPQCSCTRASLAELKTILEHTPGAVSAWIVVLKPSGMGDEWAEAGSAETARNMSDVTVVTDDNGTEADRFGALTSGHTVLYSSAGKLEFSGGITAARGHVGDNSGERAVVSLVASGKADATRHEVYGCGLHDPGPKSGFAARLDAEPTSGFAARLNSEPTSGVSAPLDSKPTSALDAGLGSGPDAEASSAP